MYFFLSLSHNDKSIHKNNSIRNDKNNNNDDDEDDKDNKRISSDWLALLK
jgi:hypothetical protein